MNIRHQRIPALALVRAGIALALLALALTLGIVLSRTTRASSSVDLDLGDAPESGTNYPTTLANSGASHVLGSSVYLGYCVDGEADGQPTAAALGDDVNVGSPVYGGCARDRDEEGVSFPDPMYAGGMAHIEVIASASCTLSAWIDFNKDGDWADAGEDLFPGGTALSAGLNTLPISVTAGAVVTDTYARFRCTTDGAVAVTGQASDGEVEDYVVAILPTDARDYGDAPDPGYPTLLASNGPYHSLGSGLHLGTCVDAEPDGLPTLPANGDDVAIGDPINGTCTGGDDEDGVTFEPFPVGTPTDTLIPGSQYTIRASSNKSCTLSGWIDYNGDGDWADAGEDVIPGGAVIPDPPPGWTTGSTQVHITVPAGATTTTSYARFRCTTSGVISYTGAAIDGEVEDYRLRIGAPLDLGDAPDPTFPTLLVSDGARHALGGSVYLGSCVDSDYHGQPTPLALGDDATAGDQTYGTCTGDDDEDGVTFTSGLAPGTTASVDVTANAACTLSAWIDFSHDGDWGDAGEDLFPGGTALSAGVNNLSFAVPGGAVDGPSHARFRCTTSDVISYTGLASDGEVEDYAVEIGTALDLGDAPDPAYPTLLTSVGASHVLGSDVYLGSCVDAEVNGQPTAAADGDDVNGSGMVRGTCTGGDDEDGVAFTTALTVDETADVQVTANAACTLTAWIDFNQDGDWADAGEALFPGGTPLGAGANNLSFGVPAGAVEGGSYARFRCTTDGAVSYTGPATDGEVEDYAVAVGLPPDMGDAPAPYPTLLASSGPSHGLGSSVFLGLCVDGEANGQPNPFALGDDVNASIPGYGDCSRGDDEDGVALPPLLYAGGTASVDVTANDACTLSGWVDFTADGDWNDAGEDVFPGGTALSAGVNNLSFVVPVTAVLTDTYARFRCASTAVLTYAGPASDGEVEDYRVTITSTYDLGDAPDPTFPTLLANGGAYHLISSNVYLGSCVDAEDDGQPTATVDGDDLSAGSPVLGTCTGIDDEDGVTFTTVLTPGETAGVDVTANAACTLSAWIDFAGDGDWADGDENLWPGGTALSAGVNGLSFAVPADAVEDLVHARFRCTTDGAVSYTGQASDGEVEDYTVKVGPILDLGDAPDPTYPTVLASDGASHVLGPVYLGTCVDAEVDGQPSAAAAGDAAAGYMISGTCPEQDDENGVAFSAPLTVGTTADVDVTANAACTLSGWVDFNKDGDWADPGEDLFPGGQALSAGLNALTFTIPADALWGSTYARFRCTTDGAVSYTGQASDGEVEDYEIRINLGDALHAYLPLACRNHFAAPDLVIESLTATSNDVQVVIRNQGTAATSSEFWVDVYVDPDPVPTTVNQIWPYLADEGLVWGIFGSIGMGEAITLTINDAYYYPEYSYVSWPLAAGTPVYAQVDSYGESAHGAILETHEITGGAYNNIAVTTASP